MTRNLRKNQLILAILITSAGPIVSGSAIAQTNLPQSGGTLVFPVHTGEPGNYDCHAGNQTLAFRIAPHYSSLLKIDADNYPRIRGDLAKTWNISEDGLTYTIKLHSNVHFHDGSLLNSTDVKASYDRMRAPPSGVVSVRKAMFEDIDTIETPDPTTVIFKLKDINAAMLQLMAMPYACIYSSKLLVSDPNYPTRRIMGTGPFKFVRYSPGSEWVGERFENYFNKPKPYLDGFRAISITGQGATNALLSGQVHYNLRGLTPSDQEKVRETRGDKVNFVGGKISTSAFQFVALNTERKPFQDIRVRQALNLAIDRWAGSKVLRTMTGMSLVGGFTRPGSPFARTEQELSMVPGWEPDIDAARAKAKKLLADAGYSNLKLTFINRTASPFWGVFLIDQLRRIGVTVDNVMLDNPQVQARKISGEYDLMIESFPEFSDDPIVQWNYFLPSKTNPANTSRSNDDKLQSLYLAQKRAMNPEERKQHVRDLENYLVEQAYVLPLFWLSWSRAISKDIGGLGDLPSNFLKQDLSDIWLKSAPPR